MKFNKFTEQVNTKLIELATGQLYVTDVSKEEMWAVYINSFPKGTNNVYKERSEHECNVCRQFISRAGNIVAEIDGKLQSVWQVAAEEPYATVAKAMSDLVLSKPIRTIFLHDEVKIGAKITKQVLEPDQSINWAHFWFNIPETFISRDIATDRAKAESTVAVLKRGLNEISMEAINTVSELIASNSIHRGAEYRNAVAEFKHLSELYHALPTDKEKDIFVWANYKKSTAKIRTTVIGTLLQALSEGKNLESSVKSYEDKVSGTNFKRSKPLATPGMIKKAVDKITKLGLESALQRRYAVLEDISINNVIYADRTIAPQMKDTLLDKLMLDAKPRKVQDYKNVEEITIDDFITNIVPTVTSIEALVKNNHVGNLVSLVAPSDPTSKNMLKWNNNFTWSYNGDITSAMKKAVKSAGGAVDGVLRFSIQWNEKGMDRHNDLDAHCQTPNFHIYFGSKYDRNGGQLDVDIQNPGPKTAVENITWPDLDNMSDGDYKFYVVNYSGPNKGGFRAEIEMNGVIHEFNYDKCVTSNVQVATVTLRNGNFILSPKLPATEANPIPRTVWGINTETFQPVTTIMYSPNFWDGQEIGNKHYFFTLNKCINPLETRGLYTEFLMGELHNDRKVFEMLGSKFMCPASDAQLSGLGFGSTQRAELIVKVKGAFTRMLKIKF